MNYFDLEEALEDLLAEASQAVHAALCTTRARDTQGLAECQDSGGPTTLVSTPAQTTRGKRAVLHEPTNPPPPPMEETENACLRLREVAQNLLDWHPSTELATTLVRCGVYLDPLSVFGQGGGRHDRPVVVTLHHSPMAGTTEMRGLPGTCKTRSLYPSGAASTAGHGRDEHSLTTRS